MHGWNFFFALRKRWERERERAKERERARGSVGARVTATTRRPARRAEGEASRWNPRPSSLPWMIGKGNASFALWRRNEGS